MIHKTESQRHRSLIILLLVLLTALVLRMVYFYEFRASPYYDHPMVDAQGYDVYGWQIAQGDWWGGNAVFFQDPLYPYFLAVIYRLVGHSLTVVYIIQALIGTATCLFVVLLTRRIFVQNSHRDTITLIAGLFCALATPLVFYDFLVLKTTLTVFLTVAHLFLLIALLDLIRNRTEFKLKDLMWCGLGAGILLGLNLANRGNYTLLIPIFGTWLIWQLWVNVKTARLTLAVIAVYTTGALLVVTPITLRNYYVGGEWVLITSQGGVNFYLGNNPNADGMLSRPEEVRTNPLMERQDYLKLAERETGKKLSWREMDDYYLHKALKWIRDEPGNAAQLYLKKWNLWFAGMEIADNYSFNFMKQEYSNAMRLPVATAYTFGALGWIGLVLVCVRFRKKTSMLSLANPGLALLCLFVLAYSGSITLFYIKSRLRVPIYPVLMIFAAAFLVWGATELKKRIMENGVAVALVTMMSIALVYRPVFQPNWPGTERNVEGTQHFNLGVIYLNKNMVDVALKHFGTAGVLITSNFTALNMIADTYLKLGLRERSRELYRAKTRQQPEYYSGWYNLALLEMREGQYEEAESALQNLLINAKGQKLDLAPELPRPQLLLGDIYVEKGEFEQARRMYHQYFLPKEWMRVFSNRGYRQATKLLLNSTEPSEFSLGIEALLHAVIYVPDSESVWLKQMFTLVDDVKKKNVLRKVSMNLVEQGALDSRHLAEFQDTGK